MKVKDYLDQFPTASNVTFIVAKAVKDENTPFYHEEYRTSPMYYAGSLRDMQWAMDLNILNDHQPPIDWISGAEWGASFEKGWLTSMLVISDKDINLLYSKEQAERTLKFIEKKIKEH